MDTTTIYRFLKNMTRGRRAYVDVLPCDQLKNISRHTFPLYLTVNNKPAGDPGEHWVAIHVRSKNGPVTFFCSYGLGIDFYPTEFKDFVQQFNGPIIENIRPLQSFGSDVCGQYAIYFLYNKMNGCCIMSTYCHFSSRTSANDNKVRRFVKFKNHLLHGKCNIKKNIINQCCVKF